MKVKVGLFTLILSAYASASFAQTMAEQRSSLTIGDVVPDITINKIFNYPMPTAKLSDFKGKLVVLDFWNIECAPCIKAFTKMQKLQEKFGDKIQILLVNTLNSYEYWKAKYGNFPGTHPSQIMQNLKLPVVFDLPDDTWGAMEGRLGKSFVHGAEPFHVWIDEEGRVVSMTAETVYTNEETIGRYLAGEKTLNIRRSYTAGDLYDYIDDSGVEIVPLKGYYRSIIRPENAWLIKQIQYSSVFTSPLNSRGVTGKIFDSLTNKLVGIRQEGYLLLQLKDTYKEGTAKYGNSRTFFEGETARKLIPPVDIDSLDRYIYKSMFLYELRIPPVLAGKSDEETEKILQYYRRKDIERLIGVKSGIEKRLIKCWVVSKGKKAESKLRVTGVSPSQRVSERSGDSLVIKGWGFGKFTGDALTNSLRCPGDPLVIDETGFNRRPYNSTNFQIYMVLHSSLRDLSALNKELRKYDLRITEEYRLMDVLVIRDDNLDLE